MPSAATHDRIAMVAAGVLLVPSYLVLRYGFDQAPDTAYTGTLILVGSHIFGSWWLSPDLDLDSKIDDRWGPLRPLWLPYMKAVPHRHLFSHSGVSGVVRLCYLGLMIFGTLALLSFICYLLLGIDPNYHHQFREWLWGSIAYESSPFWLIVTGVVISDIIHVAADVLSTRRKRSRRRR